MRRVPADEATLNTQAANGHPTVVAKLHRGKQNSVGGGGEGEQSGNVASVAAGLKKADMA